MVNGAVDYVDKKGESIAVKAHIGSKEFIVGAVVNDETVISPRKGRVSIGDIKKGNNVCFGHTLEEKTSIRRGY